ncbi:MAG: tetratricopeptide repeat protein [Methylovulum sp.]|nr:tetratricopeptide repeat protein [Methylovulum sp.]
MKHNKKINRNGLAVLAIGILSSSPLVMSATYDQLNLQQKHFNEIDQIAPLNNESGSSPSMLDSLQQAEVNNKKSSYREVLNLLKQNKLKNARDKISALLKKTPGDSEFYNLQALLETLEKNTFAAQQSYQKALQLNPKNILAYLGIAKINLEAGEMDKAKDYANKALAINNKIIGAYLLLADIANKQKNNIEVESVLLTAHEKVKGDITSEIEVIKNLGKFYAVQKQPEKIQLLSEDLVKRYPNNSQAMSVLAGVQIVNDKKALAEQTLRQIIDQEKHDTNHRLLLAKLLSEQPDKEKEVLKLLDEASKIEPNNPQALVFKTAYLIKLQRYPEASELANKTETLFPKLVLGKLLKGDVFLAEKKLDKALESYQQAYKTQPNDKVLFTIVDIMNAQKKSPEAIKFLDKALEKNPKNGAIHFKLAVVYQQLNDNPKAENHYQAILAGQPDNVLALNNLAWLYVQRNNPQAIELAKKAYAKSPESAAIADTYGYILVKQGQAVEGLTVLEKAASLAPAANDIQFHLAEAYAANNNRSKAVEILETLAKAGQDFSEKKAALNLLDTLKPN